MSTVATKQAVWDLLRSIPDPEIPVVSLVDLEIVTEVRVLGTGVDVTLRPTFSGCPALTFMKDEVVRVLTENGYSPVHVNVDHTKRWSTNDLGPDVRERLRAIGIAPPPQMGESLVAALELPVACPHCGAASTTLESSFGSTLCKQIFYCQSCRQSFERFKPL